MGNYEQKNKEHRERRRSPRIKRRDVVQYRIENLPFGRVRKGTSQIRDLSKNGVALTINFPVILKATIKVKLKLPVLEELVELEGRIVACEEIRKNTIYVIRLEFINVTEEQKELLERFIRVFLSARSTKKRLSLN
jgi:c-di-GMP-binding flagellar brake protein YcgR